ncbi:MAG TPA: glycosyltransferase family 2 protein [Flavisolibacter sp.]|jgi:glycosyltransferase involved in cell wall biosynthesis|nr:glycosyltransferase family 2 protein [Flavisolibacter sp.]
MQNNTPKVSVIIPAYNEEAYIVKTLEALQRQDYTNFEVIVINNASSDRTAEKVAAFIYRHNLHFQFRLVHERRQGTQWARECGRRVATGEIIAQLDADCLPPSGWISKGISLLQAHHLVAVAGPYDYFDSSFLTRAFTYASQRWILPPLNRLLQQFRKGGVIIGGNVFIRASALAQCGGYNTALHFYGDDADMAVKLSTVGAILFTATTTVKSSSRRYSAAGFFQVQSRYTRAFFQTLLHKGMNPGESREILHPR